MQTAAQLVASTTIVEILSVSAKPCGVAFTRLKNYVDDISHINMLHGDLIGFGLHQGLCLPSILDWKTGVVANLTDGPNVMVCQARQTRYIAPLMRLREGLCRCRCTKML